MFVTRSDAIVVKGHLQDLVDRVKAAGRAALPIRITRLPYVQRPKWRTGAQMYQVKVSAELFTPHGNSIRPVMSLEPLKKGQGIRFTASNNVGLPFGNNYKIEWRITNTDRAAYDADALRGEFYRSDVGNSRSEGLSYREVHFAEAFLIGKHDNRFYGKSDPFYVVIE